MFKIRQVFNEKIQEQDIATKPVDTSSEEKKTEDSADVSGVAVVKSSTVLQTSTRSSSSMSNSMRPSNFEDGYKSDLY